MRGNTVRKPILIVAFIAALIVVGLGIWYVVWLQAAGRAVREGERLNLLVVVEQAATDGGDLEIELVSLVPEASVAFLAIPSDLGALRGSGEIARLRDVYLDEGISGLRGSIETLLGIEIDHYASASGESFASAVDGFDGLAIDVIESVVYTDRAAEPAIQVELRPGEQRLNGAVTLGFLRGVSEADDDGVRQNQVLDAFLRTALYDCALGEPMVWSRTDHEAIDSDLDARTLARVVEAIAALGSSKRTMDVIPRGERVDGETGYSRLRIIEAQRLVAERVRGVDVLTPDEVSVAVFNGNGVRLLASRLSEYLQARGFRIQAIANAESFTYNASYIVVLTDEAKAAILRDTLPGDALVVGPEEFEPHYAALRDLVPEGTDLMLVAGAEMELD